MYVHDRFFAFMFADTSPPTTVGVTSQSRDGLHPAEVALIVILILLPVAIAAAVILWYRVM